MRSVSAKIMAGCLLALILSLAAFILISQTVIERNLIEPLIRVNDFQMHQARTAYEASGPLALAKYVADLELFLKARYYLTDAAGIDLATGEHRSELVASMKGKSQSAANVGGNVVLGKLSSDGRYYWFAVVNPPYSGTIFVPFYVVVFALVAALYWLMAAQIASPLRKLSATVESFGQGGLKVRLPWKRRDDIGDLARSFNQMADRIQTLLAAERQLLQDVSHELRSPLARLTFAAEMVRKTPDRDLAVGRLRHEIDRLSELVHTLLDMTRAEGDPAMIEMDDVSLVDLIRVIEEDCTVEASAHGCRLELKQLDDLHIKGNPELLRRAVENVFRNAIRYSPESAVVEISLRRHAQAMVITVRDHGPGIPAEFLSAVFTPFFRVDTARVENTGGIGLGLAIARRAVLLHRGEITAANADPGLLVRISLPAS